MQFESSVEILPIEKLKFDNKGHTQRIEGINNGHVNGIVRNFNRAALGQLIVSDQGDGTYIILDGAHRYTACGIVGVTHVECRVFSALTKAEEAALFIAYNTKKDPSALSKFLARVTEGEPVAVDIASIVSKNNWAIGVHQAHSTGVITAVQALEAVYTRSGGIKPKKAYPNVLNASIGILTRGWGYDSAAMNGVLLQGMGQLVGQHAATLDVTKLINELQKTTPRMVIGNAKQYKEVRGGTVSTCVAAYFVTLHNKSKRVNLLPPWNH